jgi:hypothetical protein
MNLDALLAPIEPAKPRLCKIGTLLTTLDEPYRSALENLVTVKHSEGGLSDQALCGRLREAGISMSVSTVHYHRRGLCSCVKGMVG